MPFWISIAALGLLQAALVALPDRLPPVPWGLDRLRGAWWALAPAASIVLVIVAIDAFEGAATFLTYLALVAVPPLAAVALGWLVRGARPPLAFVAAALFAIAWACLGSLAGGTAATVLSGLACVTLGWLLVAVVPAALLRWGIYAMAAIDAVLVAGDLLQGPNSVLSAAAPAADLPRLQVAAFGHARMGFGDHFVAALVGCLLAADGPNHDDIRRESARRQLWCAGVVVVLALSFDLLFFAVDELPATVPVAVALALTQRLRFSPTGPGT
jgi:hypothetical protein